MSAHIIISNNANTRLERFLCVFLKFHEMGRVGQQGPILCCMTCIVAGLHRKLVVTYLSTNQH